MTDPINWFDGALGWIFHGPMHRITFSKKGDYSGVQVEMLLRQYGIRVWGREANDDEVSFFVKLTQAEWAEYILCRARVPITCLLLNPHNATYADRNPHGAMPTPWTKSGIGPHTLIDHLIDWIDRLGGADRR